VVVAGYVATEAQWLAFEPEWRSTLARFKLGNEFHMTDFMSQRYSSLKRDQILSALASVIRANTLRPFVCAIDIAAYKRVNDELALEECHGAPFAIAARGLAKELKEWRAETLQPDDQLLTFVEEGTKHYGQMEQVFKRDRIPVPNRVPKAMPQVQPCDILAWEAFNYLRSGSPARLGKNLYRLVHSICEKQELGGVFYEADLRSICAKTDVYPRSTLGKGDTIRFHSERKRVRNRTIDGRQLEVPVNDKQNSRSNDN
jgi:hypothetical protein